MPTFAEQLSAVRKERCITQDQLAQEMNVSRTTISRWENGKVMPDIETIKQLSRVLNFNFFTVMGLEEADSAEKAPAVEENAAPETSPVRNRSRLWLYAAGGLCLLVLCLLMTSDLWKKPSDPGENEDIPAIQTAAENTGCAEIVVTPSKTIAYLDDFAVDSDSPGYGWDVTFSFENRSDIPFSIEKIVGNYYENEDLRFSVPVRYEELRPLMSNDKLLNINDPLEWGFATNQLYLTHIVVTIYGTDDNGNRIEASASAQYSQTTAEEVKSQSQLRIYLVNSSVSPVVDEVFGSDEPRFIYGFSIQNTSRSHVFTITKAIIHLQHSSGAAPFTMEYDSAFVASALGINVLSPGNGTLWTGSEPASHGFTGVTLTLEGFDEKGAEFVSSGHIDFIYPE